MLTNQIFALFVIFLIWFLLSIMFYNSYEKVYEYVNMLVDDSKKGPIQYVKSFLILSMYSGPIGILVHLAIIVITVLSFFGKSLFKVIHYDKL